MYTMFAMAFKRTGDTQYKIGGTIIYAKLAIWKPRL